MRDGGGLVLELATYLHRDPELVRARCQTAVVELAWQWPEFKDPLTFYRTTDLYLFDLTKYQTELHEQGWYRWLASVLDELRPTIVLDFGGGIGEGALFAKEQGTWEVLYQDLVESPQWNYAQHRFKKHEQMITSYDADFGIRPDIGLCICMDVLEHIADPRPVIEELAKKCKHLMCNAHHLPFGLFFPQHISHPKLEPLFTNLGGDLWRSNVR